MVGRIFLFVISFSPKPPLTSIVNVLGVMEVNIPIDIKTAATRGAVCDAITSAVQTKLGITLPGSSNYVMYILEGCYNDCGWAAYAHGIVCFRVITIIRPGCLFTKLVIILEW